MIRFDEAPEDAVVRALLPAARHGEHPFDDPPRGVDDRLTGGHSRLAIGEFHEHGLEDDLVQMDGRRIVADLDVDLDLEAWLRLREPQSRGRLPLLHRRGPCEGDHDRRPPAIVLPKELHHLRLHVVGEANHPLAQTNILAVNDELLVAALTPLPKIDSPDRHASRRHDRGQPKHGARDHRGAAAAGLVTKSMCWSSIFTLDNLSICLRSRSSDIQMLWKTKSA